MYAAVRLDVLTVLTNQAETAAEASAFQVAKLKACPRSLNGRVRVSRLILVVLLPLVA